MTRAPSPQASFRPRMSDSTSSSRTACRRRGPVASSFHSGCIRNTPVGGGTPRSNSACQGLSPYHNACARTFCRTAGRASGHACGSALCARHKPDSELGVSILTSCTGMSHRTACTLLRRDRLQDSRRGCRSIAQQPLAEMSARIAYTGSAAPCAAPHGSTRASSIACLSCIPCGESDNAS